MKTILSIFTCLIFSVPCYAAAPSLESNELKIGNVITNEREIIMEISGSVSFWIASLEEDIEEGDAKSREVALRVENGILRISHLEWRTSRIDALRHMKEQKTYDANEHKDYLNWQKHCKEMQSLKNKDVFLRMWMQKITIDSGVISEIASTGLYRCSEIEINH